MWRGVLSDTFLFSSEWLVPKKSASEALKQTPNSPSSQCFHVQFQFAHLKHNSLQNSHIDLQVANQTQCKFLSHKSPRASAAVRDGNLWEKRWLVGFRGSNRISVDSWSSERRTQNGEIFFGPKTQCRFAAPKNGDLFNASIFDFVNLTS